MTYQIKAKTPTGVRFSEAAEDLIPKLRNRAAQANREGAALDIDSCILGSIKSREK